MRCGRAPLRPAVGCRDTGAPHAVPVLRTCLGVRRRRGRGMAV